VSIDVRRLGVADFPAAAELSRIAFGGGPPTAEQLRERPGRVEWGAFDGARLAAKALDLEQLQWFGGARVPACGLAGVAVAPEYRGTGLAQVVISRLLAEARERGAVVSSLFRTAPSLYRRLGWEEVGSLTYASVPTLALSGLRVPDLIRLRAATEDDFPAMLTLYDERAETSNGMLDRSGPTFETDGAKAIASFDGVTLAIGADEAVDGYASWSRGAGYDTEDAQLTVHDLIARTDPALRALLASLGSWSAVTPTIVLRVPDVDPVHWLLPVSKLTVTSRSTWMFRLIDAAAAVSARGWPSHASGSVDLDIVDETCPWNGGPHRLVLDAGEAKLEPGSDGSVRMTIQGLSVLYAGGVNTALLRRAGMLSGPVSEDALLDAAAAGVRPTILNYF
jgi:predicted acetyltransferase